MPFIIYDIPGLMRNEYNTGQDDNQLTLEVTVGTVGVAHSVAQQRWVGGNFKPLGESNADSGNISELTAGKASDLRGSFLSIVTSIDFANIPKENWEAAAKNISNTYILEGGFSGHMEFKNDPDDQITSQGGKLVVITKLIEMK